MCHNRDTFDFSQGHVTKNQPMAVHYLVEWKSRNITKNNIIIPLVLIEHEMIIANLALRASLAI